MTSNPILIWRFEDAPQEYRDLSPHGGDEDWLALLPPNFSEDDWIWLDGKRVFVWLLRREYTPTAGWFLRQDRSALMRPLNVSLDVLAELERIARQAAKSPDWMKVATRQGLYAKDDPGSDRGSQ